MFTLNSNDSRVGIESFNEYTCVFVLTEPLANSINARGKPSRVERGFVCSFYLASFYVTEKYFAPGFSETFFHRDPFPPRPRPFISASGKLGYRGLGRKTA